MFEPIPHPPELDRAFYQRTTEIVARELLGKLLVRTHPEGVAAVRLTEVEAYLGIEDPACHTFGGRRTARTETMWGEAGRAYVYLVYGLHSCLNVVTVGLNHPEAVLIRGGTVEVGHELVRTRRGDRVGESSLTNGPGKLCQALAITRVDDGTDLCSPESALRICNDGFEVPDSDVNRSPRIGVDYAGEAASWPLRFVMSRPAESAATRP
jgi:DNA-3-methyladenine glycosylase